MLRADSVTTSKLIWPEAPVVSKMMVMDSPLVDGGAVNTTSASTKAPLITVAGEMRSTASDVCDVVLITRIAPLGKTDWSARRPTLTRSV